MKTLAFANLKLKKVVGENLILEEMNPEILIKRGCNQCPWTPCLLLQRRGKLLGQLQKLPKC